MKTTARAAFSSLGWAVLLACASGPCQAQVAPANPWTLPNFTPNSVMEQQRRADERAAEMRLSQPDNQFTPKPMQQPQSAGPSVRATWQKRPPLAPEHNALLGGRWQQRGVTPGGPNGVGAANGIASMLGPEMAKSVQSMVNSTMHTYCDSIFGQGDTIEFRADAVVAIGRDGKTRLIDHVAYRGGNGRVAVLANSVTVFDTLVFDFNTPNQVTDAGLGCRLARGGSATTTAAGAVPTVGSADVAATGAATQAVLSLTTPLAGGHLAILKHSVDVTLANGGLPASSAGSPMKAWHVACEIKAPACSQGRQALMADSAGLLVTDVAGKGQTQPLPAGRYYVFGAIRVANHPMIWNVPVYLKAGANSLTLDQRNASPVE